jgi:hypothetical protein
MLFWSGNFIAGRYVAAHVPPIRRTSRIAIRVVLRG